MSNDRRRRAVSFNERTAVLLIPCHRDMSEPERRSTWNQPEDSDRIQGDIKRTVKAMRRRAKKNKETKTKKRSSAAAEDDDEDEICTRGLDHLRSPAHLEQHRINRDCCKIAVLEEQKRQRSLGCSLYYDFDEIAAASRVGSAWARDRAMRDGLDDEVEARRIRMDDLRHGLFVQTTSEVEEELFGGCSGSTSFLSSSIDSAELLRRAVALCEESSSSSAGADANSWPNHPSHISESIMPESLCSASLSTSSSGAAVTASVKMTDVNFKSFDTRRKKKESGGVAAKKAAADGSGAIRPIAILDTEQLPIFCQMRR